MFYRRLAVTGEFTMQGAVLTFLLIYQLAVKQCRSGLWACHFVHMSLNMRFTLTF